jgi:hypothetical protein
MGATLTDLTAAVGITPTSTFAAFGNDRRGAPATHPHPSSPPAPVYALHALPS